MSLHYLKRLKCLSWPASLVLFLFLTMSTAQAQRPPMLPVFLGGMPGMAQMNAIVMQRHQARTLLYREALEELRKNPQAADVPACPPRAARTRTLCIRRPATLPPVEPIGSIGTNSADAGNTTDSLAGSTLLPTRRRLAVLFGNNGYVAPIPALNTPVGDVEKVAEVLRQRFGYETRIFRDAGKADIIQALNQVADEAKPDDTVLLFYAGHGYLIEDTRMGFWIPVDGSAKTASNWISNSDISKLLQAIPARQIILVSDSCFSGSLTREQKLTAAYSAKSEDAFRHRVVLALSSGDEEPVSDEGKDGHSIFAWYLINTLQAVHGAALGAEIYRTVREGVHNDYPHEPQYGGVVTAGHVSGGEFLFDPRHE